MVLHKRTLAPVLALAGPPSGVYPLRAAMDPSRGRWLLAGGEDGRLHAYSLSPPQGGAAAEAVPPFAAADLAAAGRGPPVYCVAWSPTLHIAAACGCGRGGFTRLLCSPAGGVGRQYGAPTLEQHPLACFRVLQMHSWTCWAQNRPSCGLVQAYGV